MLRGGDSRRMRDIGRKIFSLVSDDCYLVGVCDGFNDPAALVEVVAKIRTERTRPTTALEAVVYTPKLNRGVLVSAAKALASAVCLMAPSTRR